MVQARHDGSSDKGEGSGEGEMMVEYRHGDGTKPIGLNLELDMEG